MTVDETGVDEIAVDETGGINHMQYIEMKVTLQQVKRAQQTGLSVCLKSNDV